MSIILYSNDRHLVTNASLVTLYLVDNILKVVFPFTDNISMEFITWILFGVSDVSSAMPYQDLTTCSYGLTFANGVT